MNWFWVFLKGAAMGAANVIPGVSGGTVAFITGIYERLIEAIKSLDLSAVRLLLGGKLRAFAAHTVYRYSPAGVTYYIEYRNKVGEARDTLREAIDAAMDAEEGSE